MKRSILFFLSLFLLAGCGESVPDYMVKIEGGTFKIGNNGGRKEERPAHRVTVNDFYISKFEVYQALYDSIMNKNPSHFKGSKLPVETVTWF
ncbi:MAG: SUMF1/EgtB/PvdO family nonheme iron enzyme, partial [Candidatus Marinimicrobia bacterium]|nr:SUMF1/EgtB/PvdO family nonheme iron enzyme [Candidatus Neomarinimicrobiota bacterium]